MISDRSETLTKGAMSWWKSIQHKTGAVAKIRRAHSTYEVMQIPDFHTLLDILRPIGITDSEAALVAMVVSHVREHNDRENVATALSGAGDRPIISFLRFRQLLRCKTERDIRRQFIHLIRMLKGKADVGDLARSVIAWSSSSSAVNEKAKLTWCKSYHHVSNSVI